MGRAASFKEGFTFEQRLEESRDIIAEYPDRIRVMVERYAITDLPQMEKKKYLVPKDMSVEQFIHVMSKRLDLSPGKALCVFVKNTLPQTASLMGSIQEQYEDEDGFLYLFYSREKSFGSQFYPE